MLRKQSLRVTCILKKKNLLTILEHALPVSGVCQSEEQEVKETGELPLQSLTDVALNWLPGALS